MYQQTKRENELKIKGGKKGMLTRQIQNKLKNYIGKNN